MNRPLDRMIVDGIKENLLRERLATAKKVRAKACPECGWGEGLCWCRPPKPTQRVPI